MKSRIIFCSVLAVFLVTGNAFASMYFGPPPLDLSRNITISDQVYSGQGWYGNWED